MKQRKKISKRLIAVILCMAIFFLKMNIVDAEDSSGRMLHMEAVSRLF